MTKRKLLIVDEQLDHFERLKSLTSAEFDVFGVAEPQAAFDALEQYGFADVAVDSPAQALGHEVSCCEPAAGEPAVVEHAEDQGFAAVLVNLDLQNNGAEALLDGMHERGWIERIPVVIVVGAEGNESLVSPLLDRGASDFICCQSDGRCVLQRVRVAIGRHFKEQKLAYQYREALMAQEWRYAQFRAIAQMPGVISYDYDPATDVLRLEVNDENGTSRLIETKDFISDIMHHDWMAPSTAPDHERAYRAAMEEQTSGSVDFLGRFDGGEDYKWYRSHYTSVVNDEGKVVRIVGRADIIDNELKTILTLKRLVKRDSLTGLLNHNAIVEGMQAHLDMAGKGVTFIVDVDRFKEINDEFGHLVGNDALRRVSAALVDSFRKGDIIGRFGGDEFVVFVPDIDDRDWALSRACEVVELIRTIKIADSVPISASVGVSVDEGEGITAEQALKHADEAMYAAKDSGRDTCTLYSAC